MNQFFNYEEEDQIDFVNKKLFKQIDYDKFQKYNHDQDRPISDDEQFTIGKAITLNQIIIS